MNNQLVKKTFWNDLPSLFGGRDLFSGFRGDFEKILNGRCDFEEDDEKYYVELEVPGVKKEEIDIGLKNDVLTISWKREKEEKRGLKNSTYERREGSFTRSFNVEGADASNINAELKNGILKISLAKHENAKPKKIEIK